MDQQSPSLDPYFGQSRPELQELVVGRGLRVLDIGCGGGALGAQLRKEGVAAWVHGIEPHAEAAAVARRNLDLVSEGTLASCLGDLRDPYDVIVVADVLEHMKDPWSALRELRLHLVPRGQLIGSVPNVRYMGVLVPLVLLGAFSYTDYGVLDRTHLRFFTRSSLVQLIESAGFESIHIKRAPAPWRRGLKAAIGSCSGDFGAEQFAFCARRPMDGASSLHGFQALSE